MMDASEDVHLEEDISNIQHTLSPLPSNARLSTIGGASTGGLSTRSLNNYTSPRHVGAVGRFRYLTPSELTNNPIAYDFAVVVNRAVKVPSSSCFSSMFNTAERVGFRRLCMVNSPLLQDGEDEHRRIVEKLCSEGLLVDIIDGGHSAGEMTSDYFILLVRASEDVTQAFAKKFRRRLWVEQGGVSDMEQDFSDFDKATPAERVQIVHYIIEQRAKLCITDPWIKDMFPVHDAQFTNSVVQNWIVSCPGKLERQQSEFLDSIRYNFGEKVAYYFAFMNFYNHSLISIAIVGFILQCLHGAISTVSYMRILPYWGLLVTVIWSFTFLKSWDRENNRIQFEWNNKLLVKQIEYPNPNYHGKTKINPLTNETTIYYPHWRRYPKYVCVFLFMVLQTSIMLILVALWVSIYELLKATYKESHIFSKQWCFILLEGIVFGFFVDVIQWNIVVTKMGQLFTRWENYRTEEMYERSLVFKLFIMDFLNYYTWFFSLAFVFVIPSFGDYVTNTLNRLFFDDAMNCCFGPYKDQHNNCIKCPFGDKDATCIPCVGWFTFDVHHVDLSAMFVTPIVVTQLLNMVFGLVMPVLIKLRNEKARQAADEKAQKRVMEAGSMKILGSLDYNESSNFGNKAHSRYLEYTASEIEVLNKKARGILFESDQDHYDPYNDFHVLTVQYGFTVMFSILWPLMPLACMLINMLKVRADGYRLCRTLKRPFPRKANGIGAWRTILTAFAYIAVIVNILLVCVSTGALEFYSDLCIRDYEHRLNLEGKTLSDFIFGPNFNCLHFSFRLVFIIVLEHVFIIFIFVIMQRIPSVPEAIQSIAQAREIKFKKMLEANEHNLPLFETMHSTHPNATAKLYKNSYDLVNHSKGINSSRQFSDVEEGSNSSNSKSRANVVRRVPLKNTSPPLEKEPSAKVNKNVDLAKAESNSKLSANRIELARQWSGDSSI